MTDKRIALNNRIARKQKALEGVEEEKSKLQTQFEEVNDSKVEKIRRASNIIMITNNLYNKCINRDHKKKASKFAISKDSNFTTMRNNFTLTLQMLNRYMEDFDRMVKEMEKDSEKKRIMNLKI